MVSYAIAVFVLIFENMCHMYHVRVPSKYPWFLGTSIRDSKRIIFPNCV